jgi:hypothetical protein
MKSRKRDPAADLAAAHQAVSIFWGSSHNTPEALSETTAALKNLKLSNEQLHDLRTALPPAGPGTTGQKINQMDRVLKRLEKETA